MKLYEIKEDIRETNIIVDLFNLQKVVDNLNLYSQNVLEMNHIDLDYIKILISKSLTMLCRVNFIFEDYIKDEKNYTLEERIKSLNQKMKLK